MKVSLPASIKTDIIPERNFIEYLPVLQYTKYVSATGAYIMFKYNMYVFK